MNTEFYNTDVFNYIVLPLMIFAARICDVSIGTLRIIFVSRGKKNIAPILGFFEVFIWIIVIGKIMQNASNLPCYIGYAAGFATGNYVGMWIEEKLAMGYVVVRIITPKDAFDLKNALREAEIGITTIPAEGAIGKVDVIFTSIHRADLPKVVELIQIHNPKAFYSVEDLKYVSEGVFPVHQSLLKKQGITSIMRWRKGK
ncbi:MAG: DUF2179 domain-containing protein [Bacteroidia bacterium]|nr:DUF2179 domain-containing protein [Bacteroidia bacterium]